MVRNMDEGIRGSQLDYIVSNVLTIVDEYLPEGFELPDEVIGRVNKLIEEQVNIERDSAFEAGEQSGYEQGDSEAREEIEAMENGRGDMAASWFHRFQQAGIPVDVRDGRQADEISLIIHEVDAWDLVQRLAS